MGMADGPAHSRRIRQTVTTSASKYCVHGTIVNSVRRVSRLATGSSTINTKRPLVLTTLL